MRRHFSPAIGGIYDVAAFNISGGPSANSRCRSLDASGTATPTRHAPPSWATSFNSAHAVRCDRAAEAALAQMAKLGESDARFPSLLVDFNRWMDAADAAHAANRDGDSDHNDDE